MTNFLVLAERLGVEVHVFYMDIFSVMINNPYLDPLIPCKQNEWNYGSDQNAEVIIVMNILIQNLIIM